MTEEEPGIGQELSERLLARLLESGARNDGAGVLIGVWPERRTGSTTHTTGGASMDGFFVEGLFRVLAAGPPEAFLKALANAVVELERQEQPPPSE